MTDHQAGPARPREPLFLLSPMVKALLAIQLAIHVLRLALPLRTDEWLVDSFGFAAARFTEPGAFDWSALVSPLTHQFLHDGFAHLAVNMGFAMAVGTACERRLGAWRMLAFTLACGVAGAFAQLVLFPHERAVLIGFSGATSGLLAGTLLALTDPAGLRINRRFVKFSLAWIAINVATGVTGWPFGDDVQIAWMAHIGGYVAGLLLLRVFDPRR